MRRLAIFVMWIMIGSLVGACSGEQPLSIAECNAQGGIVRPAVQEGSNTIVLGHCAAEEEDIGTVKDSSLLLGEAPCCRLK